MYVVLLAVGALVTLVGGALMRFGLPLDEYGNSPLLVSGTIALTGGLILIFLALAVRALNRIAERLDIQPFPLPSKAEIGHAAPAPRAAVPPPLAAKPDVPAPDAPKLDVPRFEPAVAAPEPALEPRVVPAPEPRVEPSAGIVPERPMAASPPAKPSLLGWLGGKTRTPEIVGRKTASAAERIELEPPTRAPDREPTLRSAAPAGNGAAPHATPAEVPPSAVVYKSGVIDGMAYTLYTDGSIEAELAQGRIRFASVDALQTYLAGR